MTNSGDRVVTVRNTTTNTFELFDLDGTTALNVTSQSGTAQLTKHTTIVLSNVQGTFSVHETVTGDSSNVSGTIQDRYNWF